MSQKIFLFAAATIALLQFSACGQPGSIGTQAIYPSVVAVLDKDFGFAEVRDIAEKISDRDQSRVYFGSRKHRFRFLDATRQGNMTVDGWGVNDISVDIVVWSLFFYEGKDRLAMINTGVNPQGSETIGKIEKLIAGAFASTESAAGAIDTGPAKLYFLGLYDLDKSRVRKVLVRKAGTPLGPDYSIQYLLSDK